MNILEEIAEYAKERVAQAKANKSLEEVRKETFGISKGKFEFENALIAGDVSFICECKKASPSKGIIAEHFDYLQIAKDYEKAGADCISVLTEPKWFLGQDAYLKEIAATVNIPVLRKDFVVDEYMIYEAKILGAKAVLLICSLLSESQIEEYIAICDELGMSALVEAHDELEVQKAIRAGARIVGVNNRNLKDFSVDTRNSVRLRNMIPGDILFVSESGITGPEDIKGLREAGVDAVLIGETLMRAADKSQKLAELKGKEN
ncbi:indole-3-glycerol phosphate synthase TrpC [Pseudobutyrivibrio sp. YE44]|uniref:indole-3-glycerol phosphate synthase TrpC n=1 Tax=Pseudobutyrivibrio sp. YE44 TaxID=1520802 RepID=UPI000B87C8A0